MWFIIVMSLVTRFPKFKGVLRLVLQNLPADILKGFIMQSMTELAPETSE
jgi:hypothetical protein